MVGDVRRWWWRVGLFDGESVVALGGDVCWWWWRVGGLFDGESVVALGRRL